MSDNRHYWTNKDNNRDFAVRHTKEMAERFANETEEAVKATHIYSPDSAFAHMSGNSVGNIYTEATDSVSAMVMAKDAWQGKTAVLNFSSYTNPGGMFIEGSSAQEESLCKESNLYNILIKKQDFYDKNCENKCRALYTNRAMYTPDVQFPEYNLTCDVITCAAPNYSAASRYCGVSHSENLKVLDDRIRFVLDIAEKEGVKNLILGAYGCGVFGQDPKECAEIFKKHLESGNYSFTHVIFAIPGGVNLEEFKKVFPKSFSQPFGEDHTKVHKEIFTTRYFEPEPLAYDPAFHKHINTNPSEPEIDDFEDR